jgi:hypothetical protein
VFPLPICSESSCVDALIFAASVRDLTSALFCSW